MSSPAPPITEPPFLQVCQCGQQFASEAMFCRKCGARRPISHMLEADLHESSFVNLLTLQLAELRAALEAHHEQEFAVWQEENQKLRERLLTLEGTPPEPDTGDRSDRRLLAFEGTPAEPDTGDRLAQPKELPGAVKTAPADFVPCSLGKSSKSASSSRLSQGEQGIDNWEMHQRSDLPSTPSKKSMATTAKLQNRFADGRHKPASRNSGIEDDNTPQLNCLQRFVGNHVFEVACGALILANTIIIALQLQYDGFDSGYVLQVARIMKPAKATWPGAEDVFFYFDVGFNVGFALELILRMGAMQCDCIRSGWMWFDTIIVCLGLVDLIGSGSIGLDPTVIRVFRLVRLIRLAKVFKAMSAFDSLFLLIKAIRASWLALVWSFLLLVCVQLGVGLFLCQLLGTYTSDETSDVNGRREVFMYFGTFSRTTITMFEITLGNWVPSCRVLIDHVSEWFILFYIVYRCMFCFAVLKVIAAVFITETMRVLESDDELNVMKKLRESKVYQNKLRQMFAKVDADDNGYFDWDELQAMMNDEHLSAWLGTLGFERHDLEKVFFLIDDGDGKISIEEFLGKTSTLKGQAKTIDMLNVLKYLDRIDQRLHEIHGFKRASAMPQWTLNRQSIEMAPPARNDQPTLLT